LRRPRLDTAINEGREYYSKHVNNKAFYLEQVTQSLPKTERNHMSFIFSIQENKIRMGMSTAVVAAYPHIPKLFGIKAEMFSQIAIRKPVQNNNSKKITRK
jgi:hypothetical protein